MQAKEEGDIKYDNTLVMQGFSDELEPTAA